MPRLFSRIRKQVPRYHINERAAALAFHFLLALVPLLAIIGTVGGAIVDAGFLEESIIEYVRGTIGAGAALFFSELFTKATGSSALAGSTIGIVIFAYAVLNLFLLIRQSFSTIFDIPMTPHSGVWGVFLSLVHSVAFGLLLVSVLVLQLMISAFAHVAARDIYIFQAPLVANVASGVFSFILVFVFFALTYRIAGAGKIRIRAAIAGALIAATLYIAATAILSLTFTLVSTEALYGAIAPVVGSMLFAYYMAAITMLGAVASALASRESLAFSFEE